VIALATPDAVRGSSRRLLLWLAIGVGLVLVALAAGGPNSATRDLDPASTSATGTKALSLLLGEAGAEVNVRSSAPDAATDVAVLLSDTTSPAMTDDLRRWVEQGGTLVVADPRSSFDPTASGTTELLGLVQISLPAGDCRIEPLANIDRIAPSGEGVRFSVPETSSGCFTDDSGAAFAVDTPTGRGHIVALGSPTVFVNQALTRDDNAVLAVDLMAPRPGTRVTILWGMSGGDSRDRSVSDLISIGVRLAFLQLIVAFAVYAWWRARRLGPPVLEPQLVQIGGSELVVAVGNLLQQTHDPDRAARLLRADLRRRLAERMGLPPSASAAVIAEVTAARSDVDQDRIARAVSDIPIRTEDELLDLARDIDIIRTEVLHGTAP
jgi:hypothetical protein